MAQYGGGYGGPQGGYGGGPQGGYGGGPQGGYGGGPPGYGAPQGPPPGSDPQLWQWFCAVDVDRSGHITADELQRALVNGDWTPFDLDTVKLLMTIFDTDRSGTIGFNEFTGVWKYVKDWQNVFRHFDHDRSGSIDGSELSNALATFGYKLAPQLLDLVQRKYGKHPPSPLAGIFLTQYSLATGTEAPQGNGPATGRAVINAPPSGISFDRFVRACVVIKQLHESFEKLDTDKDGWIQLNYDQFMNTVLILP